MRQRTRKPPWGFHEVDLAEVTLVGEDGSETIEMVELLCTDSAVDAELDDNVRLSLEEQSDGEDGLRQISSMIGDCRDLDESMLVVTPEVASAFNCNLRDRSGASEGDITALRLESALDSKRTERDAALARRSRLHEVYDLGDDMLRNRGIASVELLRARGTWKQDPRKTVEAEIVNLSDEIKQLEQRLRADLHEAAQLNAAAHAMAPNIIAPVAARHAERRTARVIKPGTQN